MIVYETRCADSISAIDLDEPRWLCRNELWLGSGQIDSIIASAKRRLWMQVGVGVGVGVGVEDEVEGESAMELRGNCAS